MFKVKLSEATPTILAFDGEILECFFDEGGSRRIHITHIKSIKFETTGKGKHLLTIQQKYEPISLWVDEDAVSKVNDCAAQIQKAITFFQL